MEVIILANPQLVAQKCADLIETQIKTLPDSVLGLALVPLPWVYTSNSSKDISNTD